MSINYKYLYWLGVLPVPVLLVILGAQSAYWFNSIAGNWPPATILFFTGILIGVYSLSRFQFTSSRKRVIFVVLYGVLLAVVLWVLAFLTACSNGDCI